MNFLKAEDELVATGWMAEAASVAQGAMCLKAHCGMVIVKDGKIIGSQDTTHRLSIKKKIERVIKHWARKTKL